MVSHTCGGDRRHSGQVMCAAGRLVPARCGRTGRDIMQMVQHRVKLFMPSQGVIDYYMSKKKFVEAKRRCGKGLDI